MAERRTGKTVGCDEGPLMLLLVMCVLNFENRACANKELDSERVYLEGFCLYAVCNYNYLMYVT
jgi:hypothetical protein